MKTEMSMAQEQPTAHLTREGQYVKKWATAKLADHKCMCDDCRAAEAVLASMKRTK